MRNSRVLAALAALIIAAAVLTALTGCDLGKLLPTPTPPQTTEEATDPPVSATPEPTPTITPLIGEEIDKQISLYLPNQTGTGFVTLTSLTNGQPAHICSLLVAAGALPEGCELLYFAIISNGDCRVDMNAAYLAAINEGGTTFEYLRVGCLVNTILKYFDLEGVMLTIEGEVPVTGHEVYDYTIMFYENQTPIIETTPTPEPTPTITSDKIIIEQPKPVTVNVGEPITVSLVTNPKYSPERTWYTQKGGDIEEFFVDSDTFTLTNVASVSLHNGLTVWCRVFTEDGFLDSNKVTITVNGTDKAYNEADLIADLDSLPDDAAAARIWNFLDGYWNAADNYFIRFYTENGLLKAAFGLRESDGGFATTFAGSARHVSSGVAYLYFTVPAEEENDIMGTPAHDAYNIIVKIDVTQLPIENRHGGFINASYLWANNNQLYSYYYAGKTG